MSYSLHIRRYVAVTHSSFVEPACAELYVNGQFICFSIVALHSEKKSALTEPSLWSYVCIASTILWKSAVEKEPFRGFFLSFLRMKCKSYLVLALRIVAPA